MKKEEQHIKKGKSGKLHKGESKMESKRKLAAMTRQEKDQYSLIMLWGALHGPEALEVYGRHLPQTKERVGHLDGLGYMFVVGNNPMLDQTKRWSQFELIRVARTNSKKHGYSTKTIWAVRPKQSS